MLDLIYQAGPIFMGILTLLILALLIVSLVRGRSVLQHPTDRTIESLLHELSPIKAIGTLALVTGVLGQLLGLYSGFQMMESVQGGISPSILAGGLKVSIITPIYGLIIFIIARMIHLFLSSKIK